MTTHVDRKADNDEEEAQIADAADDIEVKQENGKLLSPDDARRQGELADGVQKIKVSRPRMSFES